MPPKETQFESNLKKIDLRPVFAGILFIFIEVVKNVWGSLKLAFGQIRKRF